MVRTTVSVVASACTMTRQTENGTQCGRIVFSLREEGNLVICNMFEVRGPSTRISQAQKDRQKDSSHLHAERVQSRQTQRQSYSHYNRRGGGKVAGELLIKGYKASVSRRKANSRALFYSVVPTVNKMLHC